MAAGLCGSSPDQQRGEMLRGVGQGMGSAGVCSVCLEGDGGWGERVLRREEDLELGGS